MGAFEAPHQQPYVVRAAADLKLLLTRHPHKIAETAIHHSRRGYYPRPLSRAKAMTVICNFDAAARKSSRSGSWSALGVLFEELYGIANRENGFRGVVRYFAAELLFERHDELDSVEAVGTEIIDKAGVLGHLFRFDAQVLHDDLFHPLANVTHRSNLLSLSIGPMADPFIEATPHEPLRQPIRVSWKT
jgi:hypothetical protein